ncbi:MAG: hypothetical protein IKP00_17330 [Victivallales bacterium]|nr:hypothetical protein [Victivallales bacterium]
MTFERNKTTIVLLAMLCLPCTALANAGTPLIWGTFAHLAFGNIFIGILEGYLLRWRNNGKGYHAVALMILANYFSAFCGVFIIGGLDTWWVSSWTLLNLKTNFFLMVILLWFATALLEWPFVWFAMGKELRHWGKALKLSFILQSVSYILLVGWYMLCGNHSLLTCKVVPPEEIGIPDNVCIYYIADNEVYKVHSVKEPPVKIATLPRKLTQEEVSKGDKVFLVFLSDEEDPAKANLVERVWKYSQFSHTENITILPKLADVDNVVLTQFGKNDKDRQYGDCNDLIGRPLGKAKASNYRFSHHFYPEFGLMLLKKREFDLSKPYNYISSRDAYGFTWAEWQNDRRLFALGSPIAMWGIKNIIQFENDTILFELRHRQLCLFDYRTRRIALLARGHGATAAICISQH